MTQYKHVHMFIIHRLINGIRRPTRLRESLNCGNDEEEGLE